MKIKEALSEGKRQLAAPCLLAAIGTPELDAALLLGEVLNKSREALIIHGDEWVTEADMGKFMGLLKRRRSGECVAYILGRKEFCGLNFTVNPQVLVPRPETETLLEAALENIDAMHPQKGEDLSVLDLCTGSGALAVSLKNERPFLLVSACDISKEALLTAALNAEKLLTGKTGINFIHGDLFENIKGKFHIIVSNPPYVPTGELPDLPPEVRQEPRLALDGGTDGLRLIRKIISCSPAHLHPNGLLLLEASPGQMAGIKSLMLKHCLCDIKIRKDLAGRERVIAAIYSRGN